MKTVNPYLNFKGNAEEAFNFYKSVFGGDFIAIQRFGEIPGISENTSPEDKNKIMHISLPLGEGNTLMATDALESMGQHLTEGNNFNITLETESREEADKLFNGLSAEARWVQPLKEEFWGAYFGMVTDRYGIRWMISYTSEN